MKLEPNGQLFSENERRVSSLLSQEPQYDYYRINKLH